MFLQPGAPQGFINPAPEDTHFKKGWEENEWLINVTEAPETQVDFFLKMPEKQIPADVVQKRWHL